MIRVHVICEGQTEEMFVKEILSGFFSSQGICLIPTLIGKPGQKGGYFKFERLFTDVRARLLGDKTSYCTTLFDFYGLPENFPGKREALDCLTLQDKVQCVLVEMSDKLREKLGDEPLRRFIPYIQMYEFEGLLFSAPDGLAQAIYRPHLEASFQKIRNKFETPEDINNNPQKAPSKRIKALFSEYDKPIHGSLAAIEIGLNTIRSECHIFDSWLKRIEKLQGIN
ncbi:MAG: DUF4276 family protein [Nitrosomonadaceae bacterium]|nr:DUF4276 family protein [Nitrosomonadaceae bacterium]